MQNSAEIRWFWPGRLIENIDSWFRSGAFPPGGGSTPPRLDEYLLDPDQSELGLKKRGPQKGIEVKGLVTTIKQPIQIGPFTGRIQLWTKWTSNSLRLEGMTTVITYKTRWLRKFEIDDVHVHEIQLGDDERPINPADKLPGQGCNLEFTEVSIGESGTKWSTIGFEAFGRHESVEAGLRRTVEYLANTGVPKFDGGKELSYPAWLISQGHGT